MSPTKKSALRITTGVAALAVAGVGALVAPGAAHAAGQGATSLSIRALHAKVAPGKADTITGDLKIKGVSDETGRQVTLEAKSTGQTDFVAVGVATAAAKGGIHITVYPGVTTKYRWDYAGATDARSRLSGVVTIKVGTSTGTASRRPTTLSIRAVHARVDAMGDDVVKGRLRTKSTALPHRTVVLLSRTAGQSDWTFVGSDSTDKVGEADFTVHPTTGTAYEMRYLGSDTFRPSKSGVARVGVRPSASISASPVVINSGETTTVSGVVTYDGTPLSGATVDLVSRKAYSKQHFAKIATGTTLADGTISFTATPTVDTKYRLVVEHTTNVPTSASPALLVKVRYTSSLSVRGKSTSAGYVVSGSLRGHGQAIKGATVALLAEASGTTTFTQVAMATTTKDGLVRFTEPVTPGTTYELQYAGGDRFAASTSGTVVD